MRHDGGGEQGDAPVRAEGAGSPGGIGIEDEVQGAGHLADLHFPKGPDNPRIAEGTSGAEGIAARLEIEGIRLQQAGQQREGDCRKGARAEPPEPSGRKAKRHPWQAWSERDGAVGLHCRKGFSAIQYPLGQYPGRHGVAFVVRIAIVIGAIRAIGTIRAVGTAAAAGGKGASAIEAELIASP